MTEHWRGDPDQQTAMSKFLRGRWPYGSLYVLDIDRVICDPAGHLGMLIEEKHVSANDKTATITRAIAAKLHWWAARFVYTTDDGTEYGNVTRIDATFWGPDGREHHRPQMAFDRFDSWVLEHFSPAAEAA